MAEEDIYAPFGSTTEQLQQIYAWGMVKKNCSIYSFILAFMNECEFEDSNFEKRFEYFKMSVELFKNKCPDIIERYDILKNLLIEFLPKLPPHLYFIMAQQYL